MKKFCADLRKYIAETINCEKKRNAAIGKIRLNQTTIKNTSTSAKRSFMMLMKAVIVMIAMMIMMMIAIMVKNLMREYFMVMTQNLMMMLTAIDSNDNEFE